MERYLIKRPRDCSASTHLSTGQAKRVKGGASQPQAHKAGGGTQQQQQQQLKQMEIGPSMKLQEAKVRLCKVCGVPVAPGEHHDDKLHEEMGFITTKKKVKQPVKWPGARRFIVRTLPRGEAIARIHGKPDQAAWKKVQSIFSVLNEEIGHPGLHECHLRSHDHQLYLYLKPPSLSVVGFLWTRPVHKAYPVLFEQDLSQPSSSSASASAAAAGGSGSSFPSLEPVQLQTSQPKDARLGVEVIWVHASHRRQRIASQLVDAAASMFVEGVKVPRSEIAFTQTTALGTLFARRYVGAVHFNGYSTVDEDQQDICRAAKKETDADGGDDDMQQ
ncbi:unnamed protein product [Vitrella brassicaformis CCMP3155]|uniref:N-acetyltransferase ESCO acetyl-transferase domain-containing protein n=2 Tax=Vitrella brassicaformis TaxID=1169539 RepID=A0A0G4H278_VITBC|nr:unnamed protein product [Vitrella brassicaformis CCMP3155]|mmetsp:Transcript_51939/g.130503  ORF Transcript_51939/g.130503 Transcript_51939/m.130503 type:complete len:331 (+) Transcript_51939:60-1052(+)|eukprot:CEM37641.1 unnamed protein product [Vitrella brassicaformis CCMP3155]